jgi:hypothetical protein
MRAQRRTASAGRPRPRRARPREGVRRLHGGRPRHRRRPWPEDGERAVRRAFGTRYLSREGERELVRGISWGSSTRVPGGLIMSHGDDTGLRVPPRLAPVQVVVLAIKGEGAVPAKVREIADLLRAAGARLQADDRTDTPSRAAPSTGSRRASSYAPRSAPVTWRAGTAIPVRRVPGARSPSPSTRRRHSFLWSSRTGRRS